MATHNDPWYHDSAHPPPPPRGLLDWIKNSLGGWFGPRASQRYPVAEYVEKEKVASGPRGITLPWFLPYDEYDTGTGETQTMRMAYRRMLASPTVKAAVLGKIFGVAALKTQMHPADKKNKFDRDVSEFVRWNFARRVTGGTTGMIWNVLSGAMVDGYSVNEKVWKPQDRGRYAGKIPLIDLKMKDVGWDIVPKTDEFMNVTSYFGLRYNGGQEFDPSNFVTFSHLKMYERPTGMSDFRAPYEAWWLLDTVWKLRRVGLTTKSFPILLGTYQHESTQKSLNNALRNAKALSYISVPETMTIKALEIAGQAADEFRNSIQDLREEIFLGIEGAVLQALTGGADVNRGSSASHGDRSQLFRWFLSECFTAKMNDEDDGLIKDIVDLNYVVSEYPYMTMEAVSPEEMEAELRISAGVRNLGLPLSKEAEYERFGREPPRDGDPDDILEPAPSPAGANPAGGLSSDRDQTFDTNGDKTHVREGSRSASPFRASDQWGDYLR